MREAGSELEQSASSIYAVDCYAVCAEGRVQRLTRDGLSVAVSLFLSKIVKRNLWVRGRGEAWFSKR